jgi:drug/metabolite transporter (DMT)-like permease
MKLVSKEEAGEAVFTLTAELPAPQSASVNTARAYRLILLLLVLNPLGNLLLAWGLKHYPALLAGNPLDYVLAMLNPIAALGITMLILAFLTRMVLFSVADLSFMLPITAAGYVIAALYGKFFLSEYISPQRWLGIALIFVGIAFVGTTCASTTNELAEAPAANGSV